MRKLLIPAVIIAAIILIYYQSTGEPNMYISIVLIIIFMFLLYKLNARIPHKNDTTKDADDV
jgi:FtsH-binding integral membrane protein